MIYCDFEATGQTFNNKKVYKCKYCNTTLALENPDAHILCFKRNNEIFNELDNSTRDKNNQIVNQHVVTEKDTLLAVKADMYAKAMAMDPNMDENRPDNLCSKEQIDNRLSICQKCEFYKDDSCMLCGCAIIREKNYNNKLAHKDKSCPIGKWGAIND